MSKNKKTRDIQSVKRKYNMQLLLEKIRGLIVNRKKEHLDKCHKINNLKKQKKIFM